PYDNAVAEATFKTIKTEFANGTVFSSQEELDLELFDYVNWFNNIRIYESLDYLTPREDKFQYPLEQTAISLQCVHFTWSGGRDSLIRNASMAFNKLVSWQSNHDRRSSKSSDKLCTLLLVRRFSFYTIKCLYSLKILFSLVLTFHDCIW